MQFPCNIDFHGLSTDFPRTFRILPTPSITLIHSPQVRLRVNFPPFHHDRGGRMIIVLTWHVGGQGLIPGREETLGSLTISRCKSGTSKYGENRNQRVPSLCGMFGSATVPIHLKVMAYTKDW